MERILKNERRVEGDCKRYLLRYTLVSNGFPKEEGEGLMKRKDGKHKIQLRLKVFLNR